MAGSDKRLIIVSKQKSLGADLPGLFCVLFLKLSGLKDVATKLWYVDYTITPTKKPEAAFSGFLASHSLIVLTWPV